MVIWRVECHFRFRKPGSWKSSRDTAETLRTKEARLIIRVHARHVLGALRVWTNLAREVEAVVDIIVIVLSADNVVWSGSVFLRERGNKSDYTLP
jgi:hypothetical protein